MLISLEILCGPEEAVVIYARIEMKELCPVAGLTLSSLASENKSSSERGAKATKPP